MAIAVHRSHGVEVCPCEDIGVAAEEHPRCGAPQPRGRCPPRASRLQRRAGTPASVAQTSVGLTDRHEGALDHRRPSRLCRRQRTRLVWSVRDRAGCGRRRTQSALRIGHGDDGAPDAEPEAGRPFRMPPSILAWGAGRGKAELQQNYVAGAAEEPQSRPRIPPWTVQAGLSTDRKPVQRGYPRRIGARPGAPSSVPDMTAAEFAQAGSAVGLASAPGAPAQG